MSDQHYDKQAGGAGDIDSVPSETTKPKSRRRVFRFLFRLFLLLIFLVLVLVATGPTIISTRPVTRFALGWVNEIIQGEIAVETVSLSWTNPSSLERVRIVDVEDREVLSVPRIDLARSVWELITDGMNFQELGLDEPTVALFIDVDDNISLVEALKPASSPSELSSSEPKTRKNTEKSQPAPPELFGKLVISNGSATVSRPGRKPFKVTAINADIEIDSLKKIIGDLAMTPPDGTTLTGEVTLDNILTGGNVDLASAQGNVQLRSAGLVDLPTLTAVLSDKPLESGTVQFAIDAEAKDGAFTFNYDVTLAKLSTPGAATPLDLTIKGDGQLEKSNVTGQMDIGGTPGQLQASLTADLPEGAPQVEIESVLAALLTGEPLELPELQLAVNGQVDLPAVDRAFPDILPLQPDQQLEAGRLELTNVKVDGGAFPSITGSVKLFDLFARSTSRTIQLDPISLDFDAKLEPGRGVVVDKADISAAFAKVRATGSVDNLKSEFEIDADRAMAELAQIVDLPEIDIGGRFTGFARLTRSDKQNINTDLQIDVEQARFAAADSLQYNIAQVSIQERGRITLQDNKLTSVEADSLSLNVDQQIVASGSGRFEPDSGAMKVQLEITQADLAYVAVKAKDLVGEELARYRGTVSGQITAERTSATTPITTSGQLKGRSLIVDGQPLTRNETTFTWDNAEAGAEVIRVGSVDLVADPASFNIKNAIFDVASNTLTKGQLQTTANLEDTLHVINLISPSESLPYIKGNASLNTNVVYHQQRYVLNGQAEVEGLEVRSGEEIIREQKVTLNLNANVDPKTSTIELENSRLTSNLMNAIVSGTIETVNDDVAVDLKGRYDLAWKPVIDRVHAMNPQSADLFDIRGRSASMFTLKGSLGKPETQPPFRILQGSAGIGWDEAEIAGVDISKADVQASMANGKINVPRTAITTAQGRVGLGGNVELRENGNIIRIPGTLPLLDDVKVTPELSRDLLSRFNPMFYKVGAASGLIKLAAKDIVLPLGADQSVTGSGSGRLELIDTRILPSGLMLELLTLAGLPRSEMIDFRLDGADFTVRGNRIHYRNFGMLFSDKIDIRFHGSVGFDDSLDLVVSLPMHKSLLQKLGLRGKLDDYATALAGVRVDVPLVGTRKKPKMDFASVDTQALVDRVLRGTVRETVGDLFEDLLKRNNDKNKEKEPATRNRPVKRRQPVSPNRKPPPPDGK